MIGSRLGPYEITAKLGEGGMGEVYRATDTRLRRDVAIKVLPAAFTDDEERLARLAREAQLLAQLHHPNIASIFGLEESGGARALVMELVEGPTLAERLESGSLPFGECLSVARQIAEALEEAHEKGIIHRDLKPQNIKASREGRVKVLDFGLAKAMDPVGAVSGSAVSPSQLAKSPTQTMGATQTGVILGTAAYMSPEQAKGMAVDKRSDIWAFGVVLYEMLTGRHPFASGSVSETLAKVLRDEIDLSALPSQTPAPVRALLERCLERNPKRRLRDIGEARVVLEDSNSLAATAGKASNAALDIRRSRPTGWRLAGIAALGLAAGLGLAPFVRTPATKQVEPVELRLSPITNSGNVISAAISPDGRFVSYVESDQGLQSLWLLQVASGQTLRLIPEQPVGYWGQAFTPDGDSIYFGQRSESKPSGELFSIATLGGTPKRLLADVDSAVSFSPDGSEMAFLRSHYRSTAGSAVVVARADGTQERVLASFELPESVAGIFFGAPAWSPDGKRIATAVARRGGEGAESRARLALISLSDGAVTTLADPGWTRAAQAAWSPDGKSLQLIARSADQLASQIWSVSYPGGEARRLTSDLQERRIVSLTADGSTMITVASAISSSVWSTPLAGDGRQRRVSRSTYDGVFGVAFGAQGRILYSSFANDVWNLWSAGIDGADRGPLSALAERDQIGFPSVARDGTVYFVVRGRSGVELRALGGDGTSSRTVARDVHFLPFFVAPDGRSLIVGADVDGSPRLLRVPADGEAREPIFDRPAMIPVLDTAGERMAFYYFDDESRTRIGVRSLAGGPLLADFPAEPPNFSSRIALRDEGLYLNTVRGDRSNVWLQPLSGGPPRRVTSFDDQTLFDFAISADGATLAAARGPQMRDAQRITGFAAAAGTGKAP